MAGSLVGRVVGTATALMICDAETRLRAERLSSRLVAQLARLACDPRVGLSAEEAKRRRGVFGRNRAAPRAPWGWAHPNGLACGMGAALALTAFLAWLVADETLQALVFAFLAAAALILTSAWLRHWRHFVREVRRALELRIWVRRDAAMQRIAARDLVPGDIVWLEAGDVVPASVEILAASDDWRLEGEFSDPYCVLAGTVVLAGRAWAVVIDTSHEPQVRDEKVSSDTLQVPRLVLGLWPAGVLIGWVVFHWWAQAIAAEVLALAFIIIPWWWPAWQGRRRHRWLERFARAGLLLCDPEAVRAWQRAQALVLSPLAWHPRPFAPVALLLPFETLYWCADENGRSWLEREDGRVINPLAVTGALALAQNTYWAMFPGPNAFVLDAPPRQPCWEGMWKKNAWLLQACAAELPRTWQPEPAIAVCDSAGWQRAWSSQELRHWVLIGEAEAVLARCVRAWGSLGAWQPGQWRQRIAQMQQQGCLVVGVAAHRIAVRATDTAPQTYEWIGAWALAPEVSPQQDTRVAQWMQACGLPVWVEMDAAPTVLAVWQEQFAPLRFGGGFPAGEEAMVLLAADTDPRWGAVPAVQRVALRNAAACWQSQALTVAEDIAAVAAALAIGKRRRGKISRNADTSEALR